MKKKRSNWNLLIGYSLQEAKQMLEEEGIAYQLEFTTPPRKKKSSEDTRVIAVQPKKPVVLICASTDWSIS